MSVQYLLDTNVFGYLVRRQHPALEGRVETEMRARTVCSSAVVRAEMKYGIERVPLGPKRKLVLERQLDLMPMLPWDIAAADAYGVLKAELKATGRFVDDLDTMIAAHALATGLTLVTHNTKHFEAIPKLKLQDWMA